MGSERETAIMFLSPITCGLMLVVVLIPFSLISVIFPSMNVQSVNEFDQFLQIIYIILVILTIAHAATSLRQVAFVGGIWVVILSTASISIVLMVMILIPTIVLAGILST